MVHLGLNMNDRATGNLSATRVLIFQQRDWGVRIGHYLAQQMQKEGCALAALTFKKTTHAFTRAQNDVSYDLVINDDEVADDPKKYLAGDKYTLSDICRELGIDSVWPLIGTLRHYVRTYKDKYYYGFKQNMPDEEMEIYMLAVFKYVKEFFVKFRPDIVVAPLFGDLRHIFFNLYAQRAGIPMIAVTDTKIRDYNVFTRGYLNDKGLFFDRVDELNSRSSDSENRARARQYINEFRQNFIQPEYSEYHQREKTFDEMMREKVDLLRKIYARLRQSDPGEDSIRLGITPGNRPARVIFRDYLTHARNQRFMNHYSYYPFGRLGNFMYFPLQVQPEATIDVMAPYFNNQIETIRQAAQSMPDDYTLVVKEHPDAVGRRDPSYIEKISRTPNVKLVDYRIPTHDVLVGADALIGTGSTTLAEAAFYSKPVIQLGELGTTLKLPNVFHHTDMTTLAKRIREVVKLDLRTPDYEFRLENYVAAVYDTGFNFNWVGTWFRDEKSDLAPLWRLFREEMERALSTARVAS